MMSAPIFVSSGEPAGIGPDICAQMMQDLSVSSPWVILGDPQLLEDRAHSLGISLNISEYHTREDYREGAFNVLPIPLNTAVKPGTLDPQNAQYVLNILDKGIDLCLNGEGSALVTAPLQKSIINDAGTAFMGHTEYLQQRCQVDEVVMMLATSRLRVALVTTHLPLNQVSQAITADKLKRVIDILVADLRKDFGIEKPRILVCGLNPHAGEGGHLGREEQDTIEPVLNAYNDDNVSLIGPLPADTLFTPKYLDEADAVLAMYHDQGLPVLKYQGFGKAVNITLGLPIVRTSVDHGTALDLAGTGQANHHSLLEAMMMADRMARQSI